MNTVILILHIAVAIGLVALILLQNSKGGLASGLTGGEFYRSKRGAERAVFTLTIATTILFLATSIANLLIR